MEQGFIDILKQLVKEQGNIVLTDLRRCKALLADHTGAEYKKESHLLIQAVEAGVAKAIDDADDLDVCKMAKIKYLEEDYYLSPEAATDVVTTLAFVLRGDTAQTLSAPADEVTDSMTADTTENVTGSNLLFPLDGVTLGKTTVAELAMLGTIGSDMDFISEKTLYYFSVKGKKVWFDENTGLADHISISCPDELPQKWVSLGMSFEKSYEQWLDFAKENRLGIEVTDPPHLEKRNLGIFWFTRYDSFIATLHLRYMAEGIPYKIELHFAFSRGTTTEDKNTLLYIEVKVDDVEPESGEATQDDPKSDSSSGNGTIGQAARPRTSAIVSLTILAFVIFGVFVGGLVMGGDWVSRHLHTTKRYYSGDVYRRPSLGSDVKFQLPEHVKVSASFFTSNDSDDKLGKKLLPSWKNIKYKGETGYVLSGSLLDYTITEISVMELDQKRFYKSPPKNNVFGCSINDLGIQVRFARIKGGEEESIWLRIKIIDPEGNTIRNFDYYDYSFLTNIELRPGKYEYDVGRLSSEVKDIPDTKGRWRIEIYGRDILIATQSFEVY